MYNTSYSRAKFGLEARDIHKPKGKSCGYYMRIVFLFSSLIQSLIIVSLVLFLVYGQPEKSAEEKQVKELELSFNRLSENNIQLRKEKGELSGALGARTGEKAALEKEVLRLKTAANATVVSTKSLQLRLAQCETDKRLAMTRSAPTQCATPPVQRPPVSTHTAEKAQHAMMLNLMKANFTQTVLLLTTQRDSAIKEGNTYHLENVALKKENADLNAKLTTYTKKCKEDFSKSLEGIQTVTSGFLSRINTLFPHSMTFHLTCEKQQEQVEKIRSSCTNLSKEVEDKFQRYLNNVGDKVADIQLQSSGLEVQNSNLKLQLAQCQSNNSHATDESRRRLQDNQQAHDKQMEALLLEQNRLRANCKKSR
ncbi:plasmalemma vesicle associated protein b [Hypomesus transpacificus]|uniref:plasmalemma vesicle associated protein b n=1 Tax=Hypomesus transpacificus TaxID=137520 RepID=UPI001F075D3F|nr:plasmalemma vesicle associated protein b [Hypomesus transpacificus]